MDWAIPRADAAKCAIDLALYDLLGKYTNQPAYAMIGCKRRDGFFTTWTLAIGRDHLWSHEQTAAEAKKRYALGYHGFEVHLGTAPGAGFEQDLAKITAIKEACPDVSMDADAHRNWTVKEAIRAIRAIRAMEKYNISVERPR